MNHDYVGTEHLLLALVEDESNGVAEVLRTLGLDRDKVSAEIDRLVQRGAKSVTVRILPLTPRTKQAIEFAGTEAQNVNERCITPEHLLLGLVREENGVARQVIVNLGVSSHDVRAEVLKVRLEQMKIVERAVRPIQASTPRKRKMREELLAHLSAIYEQELTKLGNPQAALQAAAQRFGEPSELAQDLQIALPGHERISYFIERFVAYRAPESAARYSFRMAVHTFVLLAAVLGIVTVGLCVRYGWVDEVKVVLRAMAVIALLTPFAQYVIWLAYIKMRDAMWGAFGSRKSLVRVLSLGVLTTATAAVYLAVITLATHLSLGAAFRAAGTIAWMSVLGTIALATLARLSGSSEIRDTLWALLDIRENSPNSSGERPSVELT
jgi:DNA-binding MarR family transcriptional regulator